jgi:LysE type translocator
VDPSPDGPWTYPLTTDTLGRGPLGVGRRAREPGHRRRDGCRALGDPGLVSHRLQIVKYLGAAYLIYLGLRRLLTRGRTAEEVTVSRRSLRRAFGQGFLVGISNSKTALFFFAFLPQFIDPSHGRPWLQLLVLGALFVALGMLTDTGFALASGTVGGRLKLRAGFLPAERYVAGGTYIALGVLAAVSGPSGRLHTPAPARSP